jgi:hypothetical protein
MSFPRDKAGKLTPDLMLVFRTKCLEPYLHLISRPVIWCLMNQKNVFWITLSFCNCFRKACKKDVWRQACLSVCLSVCVLVDTGVLAPGAVLYILHKYYVTGNHSVFVSGERKNWNPQREVKNLSATYNFRMFITLYTTTYQLSLSWATRIQSMSYHPITLRFILITSSNLCISLHVILSSVFLTQMQYACFLLVTLWFSHSNDIWRGVKIRESSR